MNKEELQKTYQTIVLNTNGGIDDYVVALCQIGNAISELDDQQQQIADLQHRLSNCIEPKFKIGQEVYFICDPNRIISGWKIADYEYYKQQYIIENKDSIDWIHKDRIFATKEEAEAKLRELQGEKR